MSSVSTQHCRSTCVAQIMAIMLARPLSLDDVCAFRLLESVLRLMELCCTDPKENAFQQATNAGDTLPFIRAPSRMETQRLESSLERVVEASPSTSPDLLWSSDPSRAQSLTRSAQISTTSIRDVRDEMTRKYLRSSSPCNTYLYIVSQLTITVLAFGI